MNQTQKLEKDTPFGPPLPETPSDLSVPKQSRRMFLGAIGLVLLICITTFFVGLKYGGTRIVDAIKLGKIRDLLKKSPDSQSSSYRINYFFAEYKLDNTDFKPQLLDEKIELANLSNLSSFEAIQGKPFTNDQKESLVTDNFFITVNLDKFYNDDPDALSFRSDDWIALYEKIGGPKQPSLRGPQYSVFITTDFLLHVYHRLVEKEFEYIEQSQLYPKLKEMTDRLFNKAVASYSTASSKEEKESFERLVAYFAVPKVILDSAYEDFSSSIILDSNADSKENIFAGLNALRDQMPDSSYNWAKAELELVLTEEQIKESPLFGKLLAEENLLFLSDYTQYGPRSHYNKNAVLRAYFKSMMWYGRNNFALKSAELTRDAVNIVQMMKTEGQKENWESIYLPTSFLVGQSDDLGIFEYEEVIDSLKLREFDNKSIQEIQRKLEDYEDPQIMSSVAFGDKVFSQTKEELQQKTKGFRFMGQRFTPDAFIFSSLTQGDEKADSETGEKLPGLTTALMVMSSLGNTTAKPLADEWVDKNAPNSKKILAKKMSSLEQHFASVPQESWTQNIYWAWLFTIKSLFTESLDKTGYPNFIKSGLWNLKNLQTALGSWTELKHDTLLYAKQSYAELGGGGGDEEIPPVPKGYVEPNIAFFDRLIALVQMTKDGLNSRNLLANTFLGRNETFLESLRFFRTIAVKELQNELISDEEFERLRLEAGKLDSVLFPLPGEELTENDSRSALIADVHTDIPGNQILYEATGIPNYIYVAVSDRNGTRLTKGLVFSYYEFNQEIGERLTDESWRELLYSPNKSKLPQPPSWTNSLMK